MGSFIVLLGLLLALFGSTVTPTVSNALADVLIVIAGGIMVLVAVLGLIGAGSNSLSVLTAVIYYSHFSYTVCTIYSILSLQSSC